MLKTFDYKCFKCGHEFEAQKLKPCPKCKGKTRKVFRTAPGAVFKGTGWGGK